MAALSVFQIYGDDALLHISGTAATAATRPHQIYHFLSLFRLTIEVWDLRLQFAEVTLHDSKMLFSTCHLRAQLDFLLVWEVIPTSFYRDTVDADTRNEAWQA